MRICREVDSPDVKVLWDLYHMQISEGDFDYTGEPAWASDGEHLLVSCQCGDDAEYSLEGADIYALRIGNGDCPASMREARIVAKYSSPGERVRTCPPFFLRRCGNAVAVFNAAKSGHPNSDKRDAEHGNLHTTCE